MTQTEQTAWMLINGHTISITNDKERKAVQKLLREFKKNATICLSQMAEQ